MYRGIGRDGAVGKGSTMSLTKVVVVSSSMLPYQN
jgi:hypothetical protein